MSEPKHAMTNGEQRVLQVLKRLSPQQYFFKQEPRLNGDGISLKPDFVVVAGYLGVIVIEVKDWVHIVSANQETFTIRRVDDVEHSQPNPYNTAENYAYQLTTLFEKEPKLWKNFRNKKKLAFPWQPMVILPNISSDVVRQLEEKGIVPANAMISGEMLKSVDTLVQAFERLPWRFKLSEPINKDTRDIIRGILDPSIIVEARDGQALGPLTVVQENLVKEEVRCLMPQQSPLINEVTTADSASADDIQVRLVRGVAGSGKTLIVLKRARWLRETYPQANILVLTFNRELADELARRLSGTCTVTNFHRLCREIILDLWREPLDKQTWLRDNVAQEIAELGLNPEFVADEFTWRMEENLLSDDAYLAVDRKGRGYPLDQAKRTLINRIFNRYQEMKKSQRRKAKSWFDWEDIPFMVEERLHQQNQSDRAKYDVILIDEAQDFTPSWIRVVRLLLKPGGFLSLCDDPTQSIFHNYTWEKKNVPVRGRTTRLRIPFRSTFEISTAAHALVDADELLAKNEERTSPDFTSYELQSGPMPELLICADTEHERRAIRHRIENLIDEDVQPAQVAVLCHNWTLLRQWKELEAQGITVRTFEKTKGLEFQAVFIPNLQDYFKANDDIEIIAARRKKIFVAMTRARLHLFLSVETTVPDALNPVVGCVAVQKLGIAGGG